MSLRHILVRALLASAILCGGAPHAWSQAGTNEGSVRGYVTDPQGGVRAGVTVTATSADSPVGRTAVSDSTGYYRLDNLRRGTYSLTADLTGFSKYVRRDIQVRAGINLGLEIALAVGSVSELVEVTGDTPMLETVNSQLSVNISGDFQRTVPISVRRTWADAISLAPGVTSVDGGLFPARY